MKKGKYKPNRHSKREHKTSTVDLIRFISIRKAPRIPSTHNKPYVIQWMSYRKVNRIWRDRKREREWERQSSLLKCFSFAFGTSVRILFYVETFGTFPPFSFCIYFLNWNCARYLLLSQIQYKIQFRWIRKERALSHTNWRNEIVKVCPDVDPDYIRANQQRAYTCLSQNSHCEFFQMKIPTVCP